MDGWVGYGCTHIDGIIYFIKGKPEIQQPLFSVLLIKAKAV